MSSSSVPDRRAATDPDAPAACPTPTDDATDLPPVLARTDSRRTTWRGRGTTPR